MQRSRVPPQEQLSRAAPLPVPPSPSTGICCHLPARSTAARPAPASCLSPLPSVPAYVCSFPVPAPQGGYFPIPPPRAPAPVSGRTRTLLLLALERCPGSLEGLRESWDGTTILPGHPSSSGHPSHQDNRPTKASFLPGHPFHHGILPGTSAPLKLKPQARMYPDPLHALRNCGERLAAGASAASGLGTAFYMGTFGNINGEICSTLKV